MKTLKILGLGGMCSGVRPVEGAVCTFHVSLSGLSWGSSTDLKYEWHATAGTPRNGSQPTFTLTLPSPPVPVTITMEVMKDSLNNASGSLSFVPLTLEQALRLDWICKVGELAKSASSVSPLLVGARDRHPPWVDPIWDPLHAVSVPAAERIMNAAKQVLIAGESLQQVQER